MAQVCHRAQAPAAPERAEVSTPAALHRAGEFHTSSRSGCSVACRLYTFLPLGDVEEKRIKTSEAKPAEQRALLALRAGAARLAPAGSSLQPAAAFRQGSPVVYAEENNV